MVPITFLYVQIDCFAIAILLVIILNMRRQDAHYSFDQSLFLMLVAVNILLLFFDMTMRLLEDRPGDHIRWLFISAIVLYNILNPVFCMVWYYYVDYYVYRDKDRVTKLRPAIVLPVLVNTVLSVASISSNIYFNFSDSNAYHRGRFIHILLMICLFMIVYTALFLIRNRTKLTQKEFSLMIFSVVPPSVAAIIQAMVPGINIIWIAVTLSVCMIFISIQKNQMHTDYLTGVNNRRHLDNYLQATRKKRGGEPIAGIMIDMNDFKMINDVFGHDHGDQALQHMAEILRKTFRKTDFIARYGGDEFVVVMKTDELSQLTAMVDRLMENVAAFNSEKLTPYEITLSIGYDCYKEDLDMSANEFLKRIDRLMYLNKQEMGRYNNLQHA